ncbi:hypothetical protein [Streptomyces sp. NPDC012510]|uniref:hypothetical protein n=1 Tax=Streptomyces sp. NPDC012510 TaxID=3364838 RepID=UPI0036E8495B
MSAVFGLLALVVLPALVGVVHDRRIDRQIKEAQRGAAAVDGARPERHAPADARCATAPTHRVARAA